MHAMKRYFAAGLSTVALLISAGCSQNTTVGQTIDDATITAKVKSALLADPDVSGMAINVETLRGQVQLSGFVESPTQARRAVDIADRVDGVDDVINKMTIRSR